MLSSETKEKISELIAGSILGLIALYVFKIVDFLYNMLSKAFSIGLVLTKENFATVAGLICLFILVLVIDIILALSCISLTLDAFSN